MSLVRLSHSAKTVFLDSPRAWYLKYMLRLREDKMGSPLFFGSAIDAALEDMLLNPEIDYIQTFEKKMESINFNGEWIKPKTSEKVKYSKADCEEYLLEEHNINYEGMSTQEKSWNTLVIKGRMLLAQYKYEIAPKIKKVISMQEYIKIPNAHGDEVIGYIDMICEWEDGRILLIDHKTSSVKYGEDKVKKEGEQLATYYVAVKDKYKIDACGYIVLNKKIRKKKEPRAVMEIVIDDIPDELIQKTFDEYDDVLYNIKMGNFPCNAPKCDKPWGKCVYKNYCATNGCDTTGLVKVGKSK